MTTVTVAASTALSRLHREAAALGAPCVGDLGWISSSQADLREAARRCRSCPVLGLCALAALEMIDLLAKLA